MSQTRTQTIHLTLTPAQVDRLHALVYDRYLDACEREEFHARVRQRVGARGVRPRATRQYAEERRVWETLNERLGERGTR